jgi:hypothetical protein
LLERITLWHVGIFLVVTTWAFGGQADWLTLPLACWGSLGALITFAIVRDRTAWHDGWMRPLAWLWPIAIFNALVLLAALNPSFRELRWGDETLLVKTAHQAALPSSARPALALRALWLFDAIYLSCFNLTLVVRQRRALRLILLVAVANALALAVFGTMQKLSHAQGLFFNTVPSPQKQFFASFVYHNHWGAFMLLMIAACLALVWHYGRRAARDFLHTPAPAGLTVLLLLAATLPLSTSRSSTVLGILLLAAALAHAIGRLIQHRRRANESAALPLLGAAAAIAIAIAGIWFVARESIVARVAKTQEQAAEIWERGSLGQRSELYRNTWRMAEDNIWFGWGMASYPHVFTLYNTEQSADKLPRFYHDAHSDWLQGMAEHGIVGTTLLALSALLPLMRVRRRHVTNTISAYLLGGCALVLLYALVEFPFGNVAVVLAWWLCFFCAVHYARLLDREASATERAAPVPA